MATGITSISDGNWHHVAGTWDGNVIKVYVDGEEDGTGNFSGSLPQEQPNNVFIGKMETADPGYFNGKIDDVRIYNRALSTDEIEEFCRKDIDGDINGDGEVDEEDLRIMSSEWLSNDASAISNLDDSYTYIENSAGSAIYVDFKDYSILADDWGKSCSASSALTHLDFRKSVRRRFASSVRRRLSKSVRRHIGLT